MKRHSNVAIEQRGAAYQRPLNAQVECSVDQALYGKLLYHIEAGVTIRYERSYRQDGIVWYEGELVEQSRGTGFRLGQLFRGESYLWRLCAIQEQTICH